MASTHEEAFREIQLSGKQLVFVFMAGVVILVVTFLIGVQVGRGVLAQRGLPEAADTAAANAPEPAPPPASASQGSTAPITAGEKLSYAERLAAPEPTAESLKKPDALAAAPPEAPPTPKPEAPAPVAAAPARKAPAAVAPAEAAAPASTEPPGAGFAIQVAALAKREEADVIVKRLAGKGYPAYVVAPTKGAPSVYRVRVGKFKDRREADTVAARLQKEEQFKPWVVR
jgi:cell division septation protein DedD